MKEKEAQKKRIRIEMESLSVENRVRSLPLKECRESWLAGSLIKHSNPSVGFRYWVKRLVLKAQPSFYVSVFIAN